MPSQKDDDDAARITRLKDTIKKLDADIQRATHERQAADKLSTKKSARMRKPPKT